MKFVNRRTTVIEVKNCEIKGLKKGQAIELAPNPRETIRRCRILLGIQKSD